MGEKGNKTPVVLVVENNPQVLELLREMVSSQGWEPVPVSTLRDALSSFAGRTIDAIITDVELDDGNSIPLLVTAQERGGQPVPAFAISSYASDSLRQDVKRLGAIDLIAKPFRIDDLVQRLEREFNPAPSPASTR